MRGGENRNLPADIYRLVERGSFRGDIVKFFGNETPSPRVASSIMPSKAE
jgi:hypothetical protein